MSDNRHMRAFVNTLRILHSIDKHEFVTALELDQPNMTSRGLDDAWGRFRDDPIRYFLHAGRGLQEALWHVIQMRHPDELKEESLADYEKAVHGVFARGFYSYDDGGPVPPQSKLEVVPLGAMTLLDVFACHALHGMGLWAPDYDRDGNRLSGEGQNICSPNVMERRADWAYEQAAAMIEARKRRMGG